MKTLRLLTLGLALLIGAAAGVIAQTTYPLVVPYASPTSIGRLGGIYYGSGTPSGNLTAPIGSLYIRSDASGTTTRVYVNTDGSTTWTYLTAGA